MTTQEIRKQISMQKMHNARTKRAKKNLAEDEKIMARYGGMYTMAEINLLHDLHPYSRDTSALSVPDPGILSEKEIVELLDQLGMYAKIVQEDNYLMI